MSFTRVPATTNPVAPAKIKFYWSTSELFDSVQLRTAYRAKMLKDQQGESQLDDFAISPQERRIFVEHLDEIIYELASAMFKLTQGIDASIYVDKTFLVFDVNNHLVDITETGPVTIIPVTPIIGTDDIYLVEGTFEDFVDGDYIYVDDTTEVYTLTEPIPSVPESGFSIVNNNSFNANVLPSIDKKMKNCIKYFVMREWYGSVALKEDMISNDAMYRMNLVSMKNLTHELRKPLMT